MTTSAARLKLFPDGTYQDKNGHLVIGGCNTIDLVRQYGSPLYVFDEFTLRARCREFKKAFIACYQNTLVTYASKAFLNKAMAALIKEEELGLDIVSGGELSVALSVGFPPELIYFHGNNKSPEELRMAMRSGIGRIVMDNDFEIENANRIAGELKVKQKVMLRINPGIDPHTHKYTSTGIPDSKFGFPVGNGHARRAIETTLKAKNLELTGLHMHLGSPIAELEPYEIAIDIIMKLAAEMKKEFGYEMDEFAAGGGFAVAYTTDAVIPAITDYAKAIAEKIKASVNTYGLKLPKLSIEPDVQLPVRPVWRCTPPAQ
jgi:diaminopimelate decarboxylase